MSKDMEVPGSKLKRGPLGVLWMSGWVLLGGNGCHRERRG